MASGLPIDAGSALPFAGGAEAVAAVVSGRAHFVGSAITDAIGALSARSVRALVVGSDERLPLLPGVPTAKDAEVPSLAAITGWSALFGPPSLPAPVVEAWAKAIAALASDRAWVEAIQGSGSAPRSSSPGATREFLRAQIALYSDSRVASACSDGASAVCRDRLEVYAAGGHAQGVNCWLNAS